MTQRRWEHFAHGSDIGVRGIGGSKEEAFEQAAFALTAVITDPESVLPSELVELTCEAPDEELLLADWLNTLVYEMATRNMLFGRFEVQIHGETLRAKAWGEKIDALKHQPAVEVNCGEHSLWVPWSGPSNRHRVPKRDGDGRRPLRY